MSHTPFYGLSVVKSFKLPNHRKKSPLQKLPVLLEPGYILVVMICTIIFSSGCLSPSNPVEAPVNTSLTGAIYITDSANNNFTFIRPAERIIALNLDTIETIVVLGAGDRLVGVPESILTKTNLIQYLPNAVSVGESGSPNIEMITSLHPDAIIIMSTAGEKEKNQFSTLDIPVIAFNCYILSDVPSSVKNLGLLTGEVSNASRYLDYYQSYDTLVKERIGNQSEVIPEVYLEIGSEYTAAGKGSGGDSLLRNIRAVNVASDLPTQWPKVTPEWVVKTNPEFIIKTVHTYVGEEKNFTQIWYDMRSRVGFSEIGACKLNRTYVITSNILYGPKGILGQVLLGKILYPEKFSDIPFDDLITEYQQMFSLRVEEKEIVYPDI